MSEARLWAEPSEFTLLRCEVVGPIERPLRLTDASLTAKDRRLLTDDSRIRIPAVAPGPSLIETSGEAPTALSFREPRRLPILRRKLERTLTPGNEWKDGFGTVYLGHLLALAPPHQTQ